MKLYSTKNKGQLFSLKEAVLKGLPDDNGLFMPTQIKPLPSSFFENIEKYSFQEIAFIVSKQLIGDNIPDEDLKIIVEKSINFPAPLVQLDETSYVLELFHGPTLAFKDFGARFMAQLMGYFNDKAKELIILVATSGDTGGAVASGFYKTEGIKVVILYPSGKVSHLQEQQLTTLGHNIHAIEVAGSFDDCQAMVKSAFLDKALNKKFKLSSANSINIARLIPQTFYYFEAYKQIKNKALPLVFSIPSGNFGNLTAGLIAKRMGLPVHKFIAATNINEIVPNFLVSGKYEPKSSIPTISNAMDVGNPSNFYRMVDLYFTGKDESKVDCSTWNNLKDDIIGFSYNNEETRKGIIEIYNQTNYIIDPHGSIAYLAQKDYQHSIKNKVNTVILETAHPSKFIEEVNKIIPTDIEIPERLENLRNKNKKSTKMLANILDLKKYLEDNY